MVYERIVPATSRYYFPIINMYNKKIIIINMKKNTQVETTQKSQATNKNNTPTGKVKTLKSAEERRKAREEQFRNFRINALRRRCKRMKYTEEKTEEFIKKLIEQMNAPKEYSILIMLSVKDGPMMKEALAKANITYKYHGDTYFSIDGNQDVLAKIREIAPPSAKIHPYAKKMESVLPKQEKEVIKKPSNNTAEKKTAAKTVSKGHMSKSTRHFHRMQKGRYKNLRQVFLAHKRSKLKKAATVQLNAKKSSTGSKKASTNLKKAA